MPALSIKGSHSCESADLNLVTYPSHHFMSSIDVCVYLSICSNNNNNEYLQNVINKKKYNVLKKEMKKETRINFDLHNIKL